MKKERMKFVELWAEYVKTHSNEEWGMQQKLLIDSQLKNAKNFKLTPKDYLKIKEK